MDNEESSFSFDDDKAGYDDGEWGVTL